MARPVGKWFCSGGMNSLHKRIRPFGYAVGQDGDPRVLVLIKGSASSAICRQGLQDTNRLSGHLFLTTRRHLGSALESVEDSVRDRQVRHLKRALVPKQSPNDPRRLCGQSHDHRVSVRPSQQAAQPCDERRGV